MNGENQLLLDEVNWLRGQVMRQGDIVRVEERLRQEARVIVH